MDKPVTKTFSNSFGKPLPLDRGAFIRRWQDHFTQFYTLGESVADYDALKRIWEELAEMAGRSWDRHPSDPA